MRRKLKLFVLCVLAFACLGCSTQSSMNGRETWGLGIFQIREGRGDTTYSWGTPAEKEASQQHVRASENTSAPIQAMYSQTGGR